MLSSVSDGVKDSFSTYFIVAILDVALDSAEVWVDIWHPLSTAAIPLMAQNTLCEGVAPVNALLNF